MTKIDKSAGKTPQISFCAATGRIPAADEGNH